MWTTFNTYDTAGYVSFKLVSQIYSVFVCLFNFLKQSRSLRVNPALYITNIISGACLLVLSAVDQWAELTVRWDLSSPSHTLSSGPPRELLSVRAKVTCDINRRAQLRSHLTCSQLVNYNRLHRNVCWGVHFQDMDYHPGLRLLILGTLWVEVNVNISASEPTLWLKPSRPSL